MKTIKASDQSIKEIVESQIQLLGYSADLNHINVSEVTNMYRLFEYSKFNGNISKWDTSNATEMSWMFFNSKFNGDIGNWNVFNLKYVESMFYGSEFGGDLSKWDISKVVDMECIFDKGIQLVNGINMGINRKIILPPSCIIDSTLKKKKSKL